MDNIKSSIRCYKTRNCKDLKNIILPRSNRFNLIFFLQPQNIIRLIDASYVDGQIYCKIERDAVTTVNGQTFDMINSRYNILLALGSSLKGNPFRINSEIFPFQQYF